MRPPKAVIAGGMLAAATIGQAQTTPSVAVTTASSFTLYNHNRTVAATRPDEAVLMPTPVATSDESVTANAEHDRVAAAMAQAFAGTEQLAPPPTKTGCPGVNEVPWRSGLSLATHDRRRIWWSAVRAAECRYLLPPGLFDSLVIAESRYQAGAVSPAGAGGIAQLMPATAAGVGVVNRFDVAANIDGGARYLKQLLDKFRSVPLAVAAYNAGPGAVIHARGIPANGETPAYVRAVLDGWSALGRQSNAPRTAIANLTASTAQLMDFGR